MTVDNNELTSGLTYIVSKLYPKEKELHVAGWGTVDNYTEVENIRDKHGIKPQLVFCDTHFQATGNNIYQEIYNNRKTVKDTSGREQVYAWTSIKGIASKGLSKQKKWSHGKDKVTKQDVELAFSPAKRVPVGYGTNNYIKGFFILEYTFNSELLKDVTWSLLNNKHDWKLIIPQAAKDDKEFMEQINSEQKVLIRDKAGNAYMKWQPNPNAKNDYFDCLNMTVLAGTIVRYFG
jgi:hypothetical protein